MPISTRARVLKSDSVRALAVQLDGRIFGRRCLHQLSTATPTANHLIRLNASEARWIASFVTTNGEANANVNSLAVQPDTRIIVGGDFSTV